MQTPLIGLLDCNNFFVSCERLFRPDLVGQPVVVLSSNDGCIVARSQEVKDMDVPMGVPYFKIKDRLKNNGVTVFSSHFALYRDISRRVFVTMRQVLSEIEQYSIDEAFFTVSGEPESVIKQLKQAVEQAVGIPVSIGVASTKTQAKYASAQAKQGGGLCVLTAKDWRRATSQIPLASIWGVGGKMERLYKQHNLITVADLVAVDSDRISRIFGLVGWRLQQELLGRAVLPVAPKLDPQQSIMSSRSFKSSVTDVAVLEDAVAYHVRQLAADLRRMQLRTTELKVSIRPSRHGDFLLRGGTAEATWLEPTNDPFVLLKMAQPLVEQLYESGVPYKKAGVLLTNLRSTEVTQPGLFTAQSAPKQSDQLLTVIDKLNQKTGRELVVLGSRLKTNCWQSRFDMSSPAYTTRWSELMTVKAE